MSITKSSWQLGVPSTSQGRLQQLPCKAMIFQRVAWESSCKLCLVALGFMALAQYTLTTRLTPLEVREVLGAYIHPAPVYAFDYGFGGKPFQGEVGDGHFRMVRRTLGRNSFVPIVHGSVRAVTGGSEVAVSMTLPRMMKVFIAAWILITGGALFWFVVTTPSYAPILPALMMLPLLLLAPALGWLVFNYEVRRASELLDTYLSGTDGKVPEV